MPSIIDGILDKIRISHPRIGLALSGGGARGFAHVGVLMAFEHFNLKPDIISGVSAGSIAGTLYAAGLEPQQIIECFQEYSKFGDFTEWTVPKQGFFRLSKFAKILDSWLPIKNLEDCRIPMIVCATDLDKGKSVGWTKGEIVPRVVASCSIPIIFHPVEIKGRIYVDGGVVRNLPAWAIRPHVKTLIGSNCSPLNRDFKYTTGSGLLDIGMRSYQLMSKANTLQDVNLCDHVIQCIGLSRYGIFQISQMKEIINNGYDAACRVLEKIV